MISTYVETVLQLGALYGIVAIAVVVSFRFLSFPDLTIDGSFVLGGVLAAKGIISGYPLLAVTALAVGGGFLAGTGTATIHRILGINKFFAGILSAMVLYSVNLRLLSKANLSVFGHPTIFSPFSTHAVWLTVACTVFLVAVVLLVALAFRTRPGLLIRGVGENPNVLRLGKGGAYLLVAIGLGASNALAALAGALVVQYQSFVDVNMGVGVTITGFAALFVGEAAIVVWGAVYRWISAERRWRWRRHLLQVDGELLAAICGSIGLTAATVATLYIGLAPSDTKAISAIILIVAMSIRRGRFSSILVPPSRFET